MYIEGKIGLEGFAFAFLVEYVEFRKKYDGRMNGMKEKVAEAINKIRPFLQRDGGDVELVEVMTDGLVKVRLKGACSG